MEISRRNVELVKLGFDLCQICVVLIDVYSLYIDLDWCWRSEAHDLRDDVPRFERHRQIRHLLAERRAKILSQSFVIGMTWP